MLSGSPEPPPDARILIDRNLVGRPVTTSDNHRMLAVFRKRGFSLRPDPESPLVEVSKDL